MIHYMLILYVETLKSYIEIYIFHYLEYKLKCLILKN